MHRVWLAGVLGLLLGACGMEPGEPNAVVPDGAPAPPPAPAMQSGDSRGPTEAASGCSWPRFLGPRGDNISSDTGLLKEWPKSGPPLLWTAKGLGEGYSSVTLANGRIFTAGNRDDQTVVTALNMDGKILWQTPNGPAWTGSYPGTRGTPTIDGDRVYHESPLGQVACLQAATGSVYWTRNILQDFEAENLQWALAESVLVDGDRVICCPGGKAASVAALDKHTGKTVWITPSTGDLAGYATPILAQWQGLRMVLTMNQRALIGVSADTGELLFRHPHQTAYDVNATAPIFHEGQVFITSGYRSGSEMLRLVVSGGKVSVEPVWTSKDLDNHHGGVVLYQGYLYGSSYQGRWVCLEWATGKRMYAARGVGKGSLTVADGMLYTLSESRDMGLVPAVPTEHQVASRFKVPSGGSGPSWAYPVVCGGRLYVRHADCLYAYAVR